MSSVDGRLLNERWTQPFDGTPASDLLQVYAAIGRELGTDAWMFGKNTLRAAFPYKWGIDGHAVSSDSPIVFVGERRSERMFIAADPEADIFFTSSSLRGDNILVIVGRNATEEYLAHLREKRISYVIVEDATDLREGLEAVGREFGIRCISVQGRRHIERCVARGGIGRRIESGHLSPASTDFRAYLPSSSMSVVRPIVRLRDKACNCSPQSSGNTASCGCGTNFIRSDTNENDHIANHTALLSVHGLLFGQRRKRTDTAAGSGAGRTRHARPSAGLCRGW